MTTDWTITFNGVTIGGAANPYQFVDVKGFADAPDIRDSDQNRARAHGQFAGTDYFTGRDIDAEISVIGPHPSTVWAALSLALVAGQSVELPLTVQFPGLASGVALQVSARVRKVSWPIDRAYANGSGNVQVSWHCTDPRIYAASASSVSASLATGSGLGATFPVTFPLSFGGAVTGGLLTATNDGEFNAPWTATIAGLVVNPRIENVTTGQVVSFVGTVPAGSALVVSSSGRTALLDGASRYSWLTSTSQWFDLAPGVNTLRFAGTSGSGTAQIDFRSTWI